MNSKEQNPWNTTQPFVEMFTDEISLSGLRPDSQYEISAVRACVFPTADVDPFSDIDASTEVKSVNVLVLKKDLNVRVQIGDTVGFEGDTYKVCQVGNSLGWFDMKARSV